MLLLMAASARIRRAALLVLLIGCAAEVRAADWPQWRGPNRDGVWSETGVCETFPPGGLQVRWRRAVGPGWSSPVVARGRVYVTDVEVRAPKVTERVLCFDEMSGKPLWRYEYAVDYPDWALGPDAGGPRATPIVHEGRLYTLGALGHLFCLDAPKGDVVWSKNLAKEYLVKEFTGITASPLIEDDLLILYICGKPSACVVALEKKSGKEVWKALDDTFTYSSPIVLTAGGRRQLIVWTQEAVTSLDTKTGQTWWREELHTPGDQAISTPVCSGNRLLIAGLMMELGAARPTASVLWPQSKAASKRVLSNTSTALLEGDYVYSAKISGDLVCLEAATGRELWKTDAVTAPGNGSSIHLTMNGDAVFLFTDRGDLIRAKLTPAGYREISRAHLLDATSRFGNKKCAWTPPAFADRHVFARSGEELVCASLEVAAKGRIEEGAYRVAPPDR
jgi:outer membrane protein assembly factor BamB